MFQTAQQEKNFINKKNLFNILALALILMFGLLSTMPALAQESDKERLERLERQLSDALSVINLLSKEIEELKNNNKGSEVEELKLNIQENKKQIEGVESAIDKWDRSESAATLETKKLEIGGYVHGNLTYGRRGSHDDPGNILVFNRQILGINLKANLGKDWSVFFSQQFSRQTGRLDSRGFLIGRYILSETTPTPIAWANYKFSDELNVKMGRWKTPHGIVNFEPTPANLLDPEKPQFLRYDSTDPTYSSDVLFPNSLTGINIHGEINNLNYNIFAGGFTPRYYLDFNGRDETRKIGGGRLGYRLGSTGITIGGNISFGVRHIGSRNYKLYGFDLLYDKGPILWKSEAYFTGEENNYLNKKAFYTQPAFRINENFIAFYRFDYMQTDGGGDKETEHAFGLTFKPVPFAHFRGVATLNKNVEYHSEIGKKFQMLRFSGTVSF